MTRECEVVRCLEVVGVPPSASLALTVTRGWEDCVGNPSSSEDREALDVEWVEVGLWVEDDVEERVGDVSCSAGAAHTSLYDA